MPVFAVSRDLERVAWAGMTVTDALGLKTVPIKKGWIL